MCIFPYEHQINIYSLKNIIHFFPLDSIIYHYDISVYHFVTVDKWITPIFINTKQKIRFISGGFFVFS